MKSMWLAAGLLALAGGVAMADQEASGPDIGKEAPAFSAQKWFNSDGRTTIEALRGEVVLLAQWSTT